jgi:phage/plasmid-associated DNA primase
MASPPLSIDLGLTLQPSFIADKKFIEIVSMHELEQLIDSDYLKQQWDMTNYSQKVAAQNYINAREQLKAYAGTFSKKYGGCMVKYRKASHRWGRTFPIKSLGLTSLAKKTRNTLIRNTYYDFDLANAQPEIVRNICKANTIPCDIIEKYCNEREGVIAEIIAASGGKASRDDVKSLMIRLSFFGCFEGWLKENSIPEFPEPIFIKHYKKQITAIAQSLILKNPDMFETIKKNKKDKGELNIIGAFFSTYLQEFELRIVEGILINLCEKTSLCSLEGLPPNTFLATYEFDGIKLYKTNVDEFGGTDILLNTMNNLLKTAGWDMHFELKPITKIYDIAFILPPPILNLKLLKAEERIKTQFERAEERIKTQLERAEQKVKDKIERELDKELEKERKKAAANDKFKEQRDDLVKDPSLILADTDLAACEIIYKKIESRVVVANGVLYYKKTHFWIDTLKEIKSNLSQFIMKSGIKRLNEYNLVIPYVQNSRAVAAVVTALLDKIYSDKVDDKWEDLMYNSSLGKILFMNGYYDFKKGGFFLFADPAYDHSIIFVRKINYNYVVPENVEVERVNYTFAEYKNSIKKRLFIDPLNETIGKYYLLMLARGLAGDAMKRFMCAVGVADCGKSTVGSALRIACGGYYQQFSGNFITEKKFAPNDDAAALRWIMLLKGARIICSQEISAKANIDGEIIKKLASGGQDPIVARMHSGNETSFNISFLPIIYANDVAEIKPMDDAIMTRIRPLNFTKAYKENPNEYQLKLDENMKHEVLSYNFSLALITLFMEAYAEMLEKNDDLEKSVAADIAEAYSEVFDGGVNNLLVTFQRDFEITNNYNCSDTLEGDFVSGIVLKEWLKKVDAGVTLSKFSRDLKAYAIEKKLKGVRKSAKDNHAGWFGLRKIN